MSIDSLAAVTPNVRLSDKHVQRPAQRSTWLLRALFTAGVVIICLFLVAPILVVVVTAFSGVASLTFPPPSYSLRWFQDFFGNSDFTDSALLSVRLGLVAAVLSLAIGMPAAVALGRARFFGAEFLRTLIAAPLMVPYVAFGLALLIVMSDVGVTGSFWALLLAHTVIVMPFVVRILTAGLQSYDATLEYAASSLGATALGVFRTITLPMLRGAIFAAAFFAFITSFDEVTVTLFIAGPETTTLPVRMFNYIEFTSDPLIAAVSTLELVLSIGSVVVIDRLVGFTRFL